MTLPEKTYLSTLKKTALLGGDLNNVVIYKNFSFHKIYLYVKFLIVFTILGSSVNAWIIEIYFLI